MELRVTETETQVTELVSGSLTNPRIAKLENEVQMLKDIFDRKEIENSQEKETRKDDVIIEDPPRKNNVTFRNETMEKDIFRDARGKIGLYPITIEDIRYFSDGNVDDVDLMTKYQHIETRNKAAQWFLKTKMHFQEEEIIIQTIKMATNWSSKIMWMWDSRSFWKISPKQTLKYMTWLWRLTKKKRPWTSSGL